MHDHEIESTNPAVHRVDDRTDQATARDDLAGRAAVAGRPEAAGAPGLLHLQRTAGNAGVRELIQRQASHTDEGEANDSPVHDVIRQSGEPLDTPVRQDMEGLLGHDLGDVRVHRDSQASASAASVQARAYTSGNHVVFGEGAYAPDTPEGRNTLAHELTHVVQQRNGPVDGTPAPGGIRVSDPSDRFEQEAERVGAQAEHSTPAVATESPAPAPASGGAPDVARQLDGAAPVQREGDAAAPAEAQEEERDEDAPVERQAIQRETTEEADEEPAGE
jgi:hypothetical protein